MVNLQAELKIRITKKLIFESGTDILKFNYSIKSGHCLGITGPSGSGKSTILNCIAGITRPDSGFISFNDYIWDDSKQRFQQPRKRNISMIFQNPTLFPHLNIINNLLMTGIHKDQAFELLNFFDLVSLSEQKPASLSGGQKQKIQFLMGIAKEGSLLLMDEPFSALDFETKLIYLDYLKQYIAFRNIPCILISHDLQLLRKLSSEILVINKGGVSRYQNFSLQKESCKYSNRQFK
jgi:molybdate transport system ATP-binding protein